MLSFKDFVDHRDYTGALTLLTVRHRYIHLLTYLLTVTIAIIVVYYSFHHHHHHHHHRVACSAMDVAVFMSDLHAEDLLV